MTEQKWTKPRECPCVFSQDFLCNYYAPAFVATRCIRQNCNISRKRKIPKIPQTRASAAESEHSGAITACLSNRAACKGLALLTCAGPEMKHYCLVFSGITLSLCLSWTTDRTGLWTRLWSSVSLTKAVVAQHYSWRPPQANMTFRWVMATSSVKMLWSKGFQRLCESKLLTLKDKACTQLFEVTE